jgi:hypothetical protein
MVALVLTFAIAKLKVVACGGWVAAGRMPLQLFSEASGWRVLRVPLQHLESVAG